MNMSISAAVVAAAGLAASATAQVDFYLTVLHNNDGESQLISAPGQPEFGGVARFKTLVDALRADAANVGGGMIDSGSIAISAGDNILAGPEFNASLDLPASAPFYDARALRAIGYDVLGTGNHEFDFNPDVFQALIEGVNPAGTPSADLIPFVTANLDFAGEPGLFALQPDRLAASTVITVQGRQIGVVGATTENLPFITSARDVVVNPVAAAVQAEINALAGNGVDIIGLTSHLQSVDEELDLATQLTGLDFIIAGGGDDLIADAGTPLVPGDAIDRTGYPLTGTDPMGRTIPVVSTTGDYKYIGRLVLGFDAAGEVVEIRPESNIVRVASTTADPVDGVAEDATLLSDVVNPVAAYVANLATDVIGTTEVGLDGVRSNIRSRETNLGNLITDGYLAFVDANPAFGITGRVIAIANGGGIRNDNVIPAGDLTALDTFDILPFGNNVSAVEPLPASQIKEVLENAVSRIEAGTGNAVGDGTGRFAQVAGIRFSYDARRQAIDFGAGDQLPVTQEGFRVREAILADGTVIIANGELVDGAPDITVVTADFTAAGGDEYPFRGAAFERLGVDYQRSLQDYVEGLSAATVTAAQYPEGGERRVVNLEFGDRLLGCNAADLAEPYGMIDQADSDAFIAAYVGGSTAADVALPFGVLDLDDIDLFIIGSLAGCR